MRIVWYSPPRPGSSPPSISEPAALTSKTVTTGMASVGGQLMRPEREQQVP